MTIVDCLGLAGSFIGGYFVKDYFIQKKISNESKEMKKIEDECYKIWYDAPDEGNSEAVANGEIAREYMLEFQNMRKGLELLKK